ncbi:MAG: type II secretion system F family protein [Candidatus Micrarchaeaceae archaeon]|nr:type II secretion system F family protein [Candidatus Marsarchaeota archaeon]
MAIRFERLVSRRAVIYLSRQLDLAGMKISIERVLRMMILFGIIIMMVIATVLTIIIKLNAVLGVAAGVIGWAVFVAVIYMIIEYRIDGRKTKLEKMLPDYFQLASANLRSGIALDRAMLLAAKPEFSFFSEDVQDMSRKLFSGETMEAALTELSGKYKSVQLQHSIRMMIESLKYGGAMADLLDQISRDQRAQQIAQKEIAGQMLMYSIFIAFAGLIAAPVLYGLTSQMILVTDTVWKGILAQNPGGLPTTGISFLKPSPPKITPAQYHDFSLIAIIAITGFASLIMSSISSGSAIKGLRWLPLFVLGGLGIYFVVGTMIGTIFSSIGGI